MLAPAEAAELYAWLCHYVNEGHTAVIVTHTLRDALAIADDVTVLRHGRAMLASPARDVSEGDLVAAMIGARSAASSAGVASVVRPDEPHPASPAARRPIASTAVFRAEGVTIAHDVGRPAIVDATLEICTGEIVGVAGVEGSGQAELLRALAGRREISAVRLDRPSRVGFVPGDRHRDAVVLDLNLAENVALADAGAARGRTAWGAERIRTACLMHDFDVRATGPVTTMRTLSGGNQQKLVLARELGLAREALIAENPTRELDVRAIAAVHERLREARDASTAVVVHSSGLDELLALSDRILVVRAGRVQPMGLDRDAIGRALLGA